MLNNRLRPRLAGIVICMSAAGGLAGCNILGGAAYLINGPDKAPAAFTLPENQTGVIFIDDRSSQASRAVREAMGDAAEKAILANEAAKEMVQARGVQAVLARERDKKLVSITAVGKNLKADFVIYAWLDGFALSSDGESYSPAASLRVKVVDVATGKRLFPAGAEGESYAPLRVTLPAQASGTPNSVSGRATAEIEFGRYVGGRIGELFFEHAPSAPGRMTESGN
ncbi:MAG: hypothetical protein ACT4PL_08995 [Phycisphaerales bacterium]